MHQLLRIMLNSRIKIRGKNLSDIYIYISYNISDTLIQFKD